VLRQKPNVDIVIQSVVQSKSILTMVVYNNKKIVFLVFLLSLSGSLGQLGANKLPTGNEPVVQHSVHRVTTATTAVTNSTMGLTNGTEEVEEAKPKETFAQVRGVRVV
jgi:hypothetical protein